MASGSLVGQTLGRRFRLERLLGEGSMGEVYLALDTKLDRAVAIKLLHREHVADHRFVSRFLREARIVAALSANPHIVTIYDLGETDSGVPYLVTEYLSGTPLESHIHTDPRPSRTWVFDVAVQILKGLIDAHASQVVHRDLKPSNVFVVRTEAIAFLVKVLDFGLSRSETGISSDSVATEPGTLLGTPKYMAPEMVTCEGAGPESDIYSLGLILHELATGESPYSAATGAEYLRAHIADSPRSFPTMRVPYPPRFIELVERMLAKKSDDRPTAKVCHREIELIAEELD